MRIPRIAAALATVLAIAHAGALAQQSPIRALVGQTSGGSLDGVTRLYTEKLRLAQTVIVENRPGANDWRTFLRGAARFE